MSRKTLAEKIFSNLYNQPGDLPVSFTESQLAVKRIYEDVFAKWLDNPELQDKEMVSFMMKQYNISRTQAYENIATIKSVLGNVRNASKEWYRYTVISMLKEAYALAKDNNRYKEMVMAADKIGKYTKLDKDEIDEIPWDQIIPPSWEPSADPSLLNLEMPSKILELKKKLYKKYIHTKNIEDAEIIPDAKE